MSFPNFSNIQDFVKSTLEKRGNGNIEYISKLNPFVRLVSGGAEGLVLDSNPDNNLFRAAGTTYGSSTQAGRIGVTWGGADINPSIGQGYRPSPIVTSLEVDEGSGNLSRKASFSITCYTKEQMEVLTRYFLEPGMSVFIEWGWNTPEGVSGLSPLDAKEISKFQNSSNTNEVRKNSAGEFDNYLGFSTGGGVSLDGDKWTINVNCTGYTELPTYLLTTETGEQKLNEKKITSAKLFGLNFINTKNSSLADERFMKLFNDLPQTRQTSAVKGLRDKFASDITYLINFDDEVIEEINDESDGFKAFGLELKKGKVTIDGKKVKFPAGTKITGDERFIRFDGIMDIIYQIGISGYTLPNGTEITFEIDYEDTACSAFENIYSTDPDKLFIPNPQSPKFDLSSISADSGLPSVEEIRNAGTVNNSPKDRIKFPNPNSFKFTPSDTGNEVTKKPNEWGYLKDLYVNFDFFKSILNTKQFYLKDALYQILNGMSSAVNGMWDFQIQESEVTSNGKKVNKLKIVEMNLITNGKQAPTFTFEMIGADSVFIDASLDLDISGAKMNQVIGSKLGADLNGDSKKLSLFSEGNALDDQLGVKLKRKDTNTGDEDTTTDTDKKSLAEANLNIMLGKARFYPKVEIYDKSNMSQNLYDLCYLGAYRDASIFSALKSGKNEEETSATPLMPINFNFKIHGISGIRRGDMFKVNGIPTVYENGFFQVLSVKHVLDGMMWTTEVTGGYRNNK